MKTITRTVVQFDYYNSPEGHECYASTARRRFPQDALPAIRISLPSGSELTRSEVLNALLDLVSHLETGDGLPSDLLDRLG